ncbi:MAG: rod shape-determining protein MreC [Cyclobacteriaceae bacterium]|nr:rod shape-determining protein MreC [Cyclobacteriaceae bacterium]
MLRLFQFVVRYQAFFLFLLLEVLCAWLIIRNNRYQNAAFFNSSNKIAGTVLNLNQNITSYFDLRQVNDQLMDENANLQSELARLKNRLVQQDQGSSRELNRINNYSFTTAKVVNNSTRRAANYLTIDKGTDDNIKPGMSVIGNEGIVGKIKASSVNFSTVISLLHPDVLTSCVLVKSNTVCTVKWDGRDPRKARVLYVPRHVQVAVGDSVVTSGFNAVFPSDIPVGVVTELDIKPESTFYDIEINFASKFEQLSYVFVIGNQLKIEKDSLENNLQP